MGPKLKPKPVGTSKMDAFYLSACSRIQHALFFLCRYPTFKASYIRDKIDRPQTAPEELRTYQSNCAQSKRLRSILLVLFYLLYGGKNLFMAYSSFKIFDYDNPKGNVKPVSFNSEALEQMNYQLPASTLKSISCLITNCTHLSPLSREAHESDGRPTSDLVARLAEDVTLLPLFMLCNPSLSRVYTPVTRLDYFGILAFLASFYLVLLLGTWTTIKQAIWPASNLTLLFVTAPQVTARMARERAWQIMRDLAISLHNYSIYSAWKHTRLQLYNTSATPNMLLAPRPHRPSMGALSGVDCSLRWSDDDRDQLDLHQAGEADEQGHLSEPHNMSQRLLASASARQRADLAAPVRPIARQAPPAPMGRRPGAGSLASVGTILDERVQFNLMHEQASNSRLQQLNRGATLAEQLRAGESSRSARNRMSLGERSTDEPPDEPPLSPRGFEGRNPIELDEFSSSSSSSSSLDDRMVDSILRSTCIWGKTSEEIERAIDNCSPLVRTHWWRVRVARLFVHTATLLSSLVFFTGILSFSYIQLRIQRKVALFREFAQQMESQNCYLWSAETRSLEARSALPVAAFDMSWPPFTRAESAALNYMAGFATALLATYYWCMVSEVGVWLAEMRMSILATLLVTSFSHEKDLLQQAELDQQSSSSSSDDETEAAAGNSSSLPGHKLIDFQGAPSLKATSGQLIHRHYIDTRHFYKVSNLREKFKATTSMGPLAIIKRYDWPIAGARHKSRVGPTTTDTVRPSCKVTYQSLNSNQNDRYYKDLFLTEILRPLPKHIQDPTGHLARQLDQTDFDVETMEQIYVNFRLMVEHVHSMAPSIVVVVTITYLLNYGYVFLAIYCQRKFINFNGEPLFFIIYGFTSANYLIYISANFHANAKKLQPLLWSLIAKLTLSKSVRVHHMRSLWLKQVLILDNQGGLALTALGLSITYVYIIQLVIWTLTIFVLALK